MLTLQYEICGSVQMNQGTVLIDSLSQLFEGPHRREALGKSVN